MPDRDAKTEFKERVLEWAGKLDVEVKWLAVRPMKTKWASCSTSGNLNFNAELLEMDPDLREYVIVHELLHLIEKKHNEKFVNLMTEYLPKWRSVKEELNRFVLSHEEWNY